MARQDLRPQVIASDIWLNKGRRPAVDELYQHALARAQTAADWYKDARVWKRRLGRGSRVAALASAGISGLIPFLAAPIALPNGTTFSVPAIATAAFFGLAAGFIALDRLFGWTSGWTRFALTGSQIEHAIDDFQLQWQADVARWKSEPTDAELALALEKLRAFVTMVNSLVQAETEAWVAEFQSASQAVEGRIRRVEVK